MAKHTKDKAEAQMYALGLWRNPYLSSGNADRSKLNFAVLS